LTGFVRTGAPKFERENRPQKENQKASISPDLGVACCQSAFGARPDLYRRREWGGAAGSGIGMASARRLSATTGRLNTVFATMVIIIALFMLWKSAYALV
jgi:hypothetical protein